jgi:hypothetical protein
MKARKAANDRRVISVTAVTMNFREAFEEPLDEIECVGTIGVTRELNAFERGCRMLVIQFAFFRNRNLTLSLVLLQLALRR